MTVIYLFVSPSGRAYAGRHICDPEGWPRRGTGPLPSGYRGSGKLWANVTRRHGPAIQWVILRRFGPDAARADIDAAERRAIRLSRAMWGERCVNVLEGGQGLTADDAKRLWSDPEYSQRVGAAIKVAQNRPEVRARNSATSKEAQNRPEVRARNSAASKAAQNRPEVRAKQAATNARPEVRAMRVAVHKALAQTPERRVQLDRARVASSTPEAIAKMLATRARNKALREGSAE